MRYLSAEFTNFFGGITDYYVNGPVEKARTCDNLLVVQHGELGKLFTRPGSELYDEDAPQIDGGEARIGSLRFFQDQLLIQTLGDIQYLDSGAWTVLVGPVTSNSVFPSSATEDDVVIFSEWNKHLFVVSSALFKPQKLFVDGSDDLQVRTAGLPALASVPAAVGVPPGAKAYVYRFIYEYTYQVGTVTFLDLGPSVERRITNGNATTSITSIPVLANGATDNYDTATIKVGIYRTTDGGTVFYKVGTVTNGTTTYSDTTSDASLILNERLYTEGGVVENDPPPLCKLVHVVGNVGYWGFIKEGTEIRGNRLRQSIPGDIDSSPEDFFVDVDEDMVGLSSAKDTPLILCGNSAYRVDGIFDELGRGGMVAQKISDTCSCVSAQSVVQTLDGVFWAGKDAFYFSDGFNVMKLNEDWDRTYATFVQSDEQKRRIYGKYDPKHRRIWWSVQVDVDCDRSVVLDLTWGVRKRATFTICSGTQDSWAPSAIEFDMGNLVRADRRGYIFQHNDVVYTDPNIDTTLSPDLWYTLPVIYDFESCHYNFGTNQERKYAPWVAIQAKNETNLALQIISNNDDGRKIDSLALIRFRGNIVWGDASIFWGDDTIVWNLSGLIEEQRRFVAGSMRFSYKGIRLTNALVNIYTSDTLGTVAVDATAKTAVLSSTDDWPENLEGHTITFEDELFANSYTIAGLMGDTLVFDDTANLSVDDAETRFIIKGYPKNEILNLISYTITYAVFGTTQDTFQKSEANALSGT